MRVILYQHSYAEGGGDQQQLAHINDVAAPKKVRGNGGRVAATAKPTAPWNEGHHTQPWTRATTAG